MLAVSGTQVLFPSTVREADGKQPMALLCDTCFCGDRTAVAERGL